MYYQHIICDWPWWYSNRLTGGGRTKFGSGALGKYPVEKTEAAPEFPVWDLADPSGCMLYFWATGPHLFDALFIIEVAWGFSYTTIGFTWVKTVIPRTSAQIKKTIDDLGMIGALKAMTKRGPGHYTASNSELCLLAWINRPLTNKQMVHQTIFAPSEAHSRKPFDVHAYIDQCYPGSNCMELFAVPSLWTNKDNPGESSPNHWDYIGFEVDGKDARIAIPEYAAS